MNAKELVTEYYTSDAFKNPQTMQRYIHDDIEVHWHSSKGFLQLDKNDLLALVTELDRSYSYSRLEVSHILADGDNVSARYTHYVHAFENPNEEMVLAHFMVVWEIKDNKLFKAYLMSQLG